MVRVQVQLDPAQHRQAKQRSRKLGVSVAEVVRRSLAAGLKADSGEDHAVKVPPGTTRHWLRPKRPGRHLGLLRAHRQERSHP